VRAPNQRLNKDHHRNKPSARRPLISLAVGIIAASVQQKALQKLGGVISQFCRRNTDEHLLYWDCKKLNTNTRRTNSGFSNIQPSESPGRWWP
jgi:hypothetical protein